MPQIDVNGGRGGGSGDGGGTGAADNGVGAGESADDGSQGEDPLWVKDNEQKEEHHEGQVQKSCK